MSTIETHAHKRYSLRTQLKQAVAGGVAGAITRFVTQPFDVLKIRFQMQVEPFGMKGQHVKSKYTGMWQAFHNVYQYEGLKGLWRGHNAGQVMSISYSLVQFWSYEQLRAFAKDYDYMNDHPLFTYFMCGGTAGCLGTLVTQPFDTVRTRVVASDHNTSSSSMQSLSGAYSIAKKEGIRPLFRGLTCALIQVYPMVGANFLIYKYLNNVFLTSHRRLYPEDTSKMLPGWLLFITGGISGTVAKAVVYPFDLLKKRLQLNYFKGDRQTFGQNQKCAKLHECIRNTIVQEGMRGLFKGMGPTLVKSAITTAVYFGVYDNIKHFSRLHWGEETIEQKKLAYEL